MVCMLLVNLAQYVFFSICFYQVDILALSARKNIQSSFPYMYNPKCSSPHVTASSPSSFIAFFFFGIRSKSAAEVDRFHIFVFLSLPKCCSQSFATSDS